MFSFHKNIILRTPSLPFHTREVDLPELTKADWFQEAIYLASPDLYNSLIDWLSGGEIEKRKLEKLNNSLLKYYSRMISRSTPFGLFAGCAVTTWSDKDSIIIKSKEHNRNTRFDMHFTCALAQELIRISSIRQNLKYTLNTSIYTVGQELRYIEYQYINGKRSHQISAIQISDYLLKILHGCKEEKRYQELAALIVDAEVTTEEASQFIDDLIENQVLVSNLEPCITGENFLNQINSVLSSLPGTPTIEELNSLEKDITVLDLNNINAITSYKKIASKISDLNFVFDEGKLFQTDLYKYLEQNQLDSKWQGELLDGIKVLNKLSVKKENQNLLKFIERFRNRYEDQEVSLLHALDNESGIGYLEQTLGSVVNPLIDDFILPDNKALASLQWDETANLLYKKLSASNKNAHTIIELHDSDLANFEEQDMSDLPPSISLMFKLIDDDGSKKIHIGSVGGSSAANLLGRFAHGDDEINNTIKEICETEQYQNPDVIFAEIIHLPESRTGNILLHPVFRDYEIPFLGRASVNSEKQIHLQDLFISVRNEKIILRSKRLNKVIIPRLSNAHNYSNNSLPVYHFLCDLLQTNDCMKWLFMTFYFGITCLKQKDRTALENISECFLSPFRIEKFKVVRKKKVFKYPNKNH